jgi:hypothetical protein
MVRLPIILIFAFLVGLFACKGKQDKLSSVLIKETIKDIAKTNVLMGSAVGIAGERPKQWNRFEVLLLKATDEELLALANDTNAVVRCYAFQALVTRSKTDVFPIVVQHLSDTTPVHTLYGCLGGSQKTGDFFLKTFTEIRGKYKSQSLTEKQKAIIDSLLLFDNGSRLEARDKLLAEIEPLEKYYKRIRHLATEENNKMAFVALSKFKKQEDKPLFEQLLKDTDGQTYGFTAVVNFPDRSFFPVLQQTLRNEVKKDNGGNDSRLQLLYQAIVQYKDQTSRQLLQSVLREAKGMQSIYHSDYLHQALKKYPAAIYGGLLKPIYAVSPTETPAAHNSSFAIGWQKEEQSAANRLSATVVSRTFNIEL